MKTAVILAGGKGTRLRPYTLAMPKPLVPVGDKPVLEIIITQLKNQGFEQIIIAVNHQAELIQAFFGDGFKLGIHIAYSLETKPLGTMGPLKNLKDLPENFLVMNGDVLSDLAYGEFLQEHTDKKELFTISSYQRVQVVDYGVLELDGTNSALAGFSEKPHLDYYVSMGVYALSRKVLEYIPEDEFYGFDMLMEKLLEHGKRVAVKHHTGYWMDIGRPDDYQQAVEDLDSGKFAY